MICFIFAFISMYNYEAGDRIIGWIFLSLFEIVLYLVIGMFYAARKELK